MKATGIVRRIDDLGRVVIPKEIRRTLKIREGMPMEIFTDVSGGVILKKYSPVGEMSQLAQAYAEALVNLTGLAAAVCDTEQIIALAGPVKKDLLHKPLSPQLEELVQGRRSFVTNSENTVLAAQNVPAAAVAVFPVVSLGDAMGAVMLIKGEKTSPKLSSEAAENVKAAAMFLSRQLEG
ncbi:stage V sporulation T C-terminal domain-containing protein [Acutalibacter intestini]|uniref:stage V sporulation T C-terminal domain-containing protein n=1 Tax=Acutalibacter intestini TaxID=3093659 RepID=UPI002AC9120C|nr:stage V sporulation T C-terminal domain-containing protein [Acutalibacter sp. M00204]